jgi:hypothetical protein
MPSDAVVRAVQDAAPEGVTPVSFETLPDTERQVVRAAIREEFYHDCSNDYGAVTSLAERFEDDGDAYVEAQGTTYALYIRERNHVRAGAASAPEEQPSCGLL